MIISLASLVWADLNWLIHTFCRQGCWRYLTICCKFWTCLECVVLNTFLNPNCPPQTRQGLGQPSNLYSGQQPSQTSFYNTAQSPTALQQVSTTRILVWWLCGPPSQHDCFNFLTWNGEMCSCQGQLIWNIVTMCVTWISLALLF